MALSERSKQRRTQLPRLYSTSRELRNEAERLRRDRLNSLVSELASLVPLVPRGPKKVDKTSVLRLTAAYLRLHKVLSQFGDNLNRVPCGFINEEALRSVCEGIGGFLLVVTSSGKVVYTSQAIEDTFEYFQTDVLGRCLYSMIHPDDIPLVSSHLRPRDDSGRRSFYCRLLKKNIARTDSSSYEIIHVKGQLKPISLLSSHIEEENLHSTSAVKIRGRNASSSSECQQEVEGSRHVQSPTDTHILISFVEVVRDRPVTELLWVESMRDEYITRHKLDGSIVYSDHRISFITGFMPEEVVGNSAFGYMHHEDLPWPVFAQVLMLTNPKGQGITTYRLACKDGKYVMLRSRGFMEVNKETGKLDAFICINTVLSERDASREQKLQQKKLASFLEGKSTKDIIEVTNHKLPPEMKVLISNFLDYGALEEQLKILTDLAADAMDVGADDLSPSLAVSSPTIEVPFSPSPESISGLLPSKSTTQNHPQKETSRTKCSRTWWSATLSKKMRTCEVPQTDVTATEHWSNGHVSPDNSGASFAIKSYNKPNTTATHHSPVMNTLSPFLSPPMGSLEERRSLAFKRDDFVEGTFKSLLSVQPSFTQIENWGYPLEGDPRSSTTISQSSSNSSIVSLSFQP